MQFPTTWEGSGGLEVTKDLIRVKGGEVLFGEAVLDLIMEDWNLNFQYGFFFFLNIEALFIGK